MLQLSSNIVFDKNSYKNVYLHGMIRDIEGVKMSKSLGNIISPKEVIDKYGVDVLRFYFNSLNAGKDVNFSWDELKIKLRNIGVILNTSKYLLNYLDSKKSSKLQIEDKWILSRLNSTIKRVTELMDNYKLDEIVNLIEELFLDLSRNYIKFVRDRIDEKIVIKTIQTVLLETLKMFSIVSPFITEHIYQDLKKPLKLKQESIHLEKWPKFNSKLVNKKLEKEMVNVQRTIQEALAQREKIQMGIRWPLSEVEIHTKHKISSFENLIKKQINVKKVKIKQSKTEKVILNHKLNPELLKEGYTREVIRRVQNLRKKAKLNKNNKIELNIKSKQELDLNFIKKQVNASIKEIKKPKIKEKFKIKDKEFYIKFNH